MLGGDLNEMLQARYAPNGTVYLACAMEMARTNRQHTFNPASRRRHLQAVVGRLDAASVTSHALPTPTAPKGTVRSAGG